ncbi:hypothetical protein [Streptomyces rimosus]|uniref:hypothetical protein n=1 Tax=Streptomyces rimosus TaxID=1927 RepID=UPI00131D8E86|nr:hypothetical protein [Streptomyces rimosus]
MSKQKRQLKTPRLREQRCGQCRHRRLNHVDPTSDPGHTTRTNCRIRRGCPCSGFYTEDEWADLNAARSRR